MRRKDRLVGGFDEIMEIVARCQVVRLGLIAEGKPYIVPLYFGYRREGETLALFLHSAAAGRKITALRENPQVFFEMEGEGAIVRGEEPCKWTAAYQSVMGEGRVSFLEERAEKEAALSAIMEHCGHEGAPVFDEAALARTAVLRLDVETITGKRSVGR